MRAPFYWKTTCHTCQASKRNLEKQHVPFEPIDMMKNPPPKKIFQNLISRYGAEEMIRKTSRDYKELDIGKMKKNMSDDALAGLLNAHPDLSSRPIIVIGKVAYLAKDPALLSHLKR